MEKSNLFFCHDCRRTILVVPKDNNRKQIFTVYQNKNGESVKSLEKVIVASSLDNCPMCPSKRIQPNSNHKIIAQLTKEGG